MENDFKECVCLIDGNRGIYIPNSFYKNFDFGAWNLNKEDYKELENIEDLNYWEAWDDLIERAYHVDDDGKTWHLYQDDSLFGVIYNEEEI